MRDLKNYSACLFFMLFVLQIFPCFAANQLEPATEKQLQKILVDFDQYAEQAREDWHIPGMAIAIVKDKKIIYAKGFGSCDDRGDLVTPQTIFSVGSITKSFTSALLAELIEEGKFKWDTRVITLYPKFKLYDPKVTKDFEVKDLLAHNSGLPSYAADSLPVLGYNQDYIIHSLRFIKPVSKFRSKFAYQNSLVIVAQKIIEKYSGKSYVENLRSRFFIPLSMKNTFTYMDDLSNKKDVASPHWLFFGKIISIPKDWPYFSIEQISLPAGGIKSSAIDMARWLIFNINNGSINGNQLIDEKNINFMRSPITVIDKMPNGNVKNAFGLGWKYDGSSYKPYRWIGHSGEVSGMISQMAYIPEAQIGIVVLINASNNIELPYWLTRKFFDMYFGSPNKDWSKEELAKRQESDKQFLLKAHICKNSLTQNLLKYTGTYSNKIYGDVLVQKVNGQLEVIIGPNKIKWNLVSCQPNIFKITWEGMPYLEPDIDLIRFIPGANKTIRKMQVDYLNNDGTGMFKKEKQLNLRGEL